MQKNNNKLKLYNWQIIHNDICTSRSVTLLIIIKFFFGRICPYFLLNNNKGSIDGNK